MPKGDTTGDDVPHSSLIDSDIARLIRSGDLAALAAALAAGMDPDTENFDGLCPLSTAAQEQPGTAAIDLLLRHGAAVDGGRTACPPVVVAASRNNIDAVRLLIAAGADVNKPSTDQEYAILYAAGHDSAEMFDLLVQAGADVTVRDSDGWGVERMTEDVPRSEVRAYLKRGRVGG